LTGGVAETLDPAPSWWRGIAPILRLAFILGAAIGPSIGMGIVAAGVAARFPSASTTQIGMLATVELLSIAFGTLLGTLLVGRLGPRMLALVAIVLAIVTNGAAIFAPGIWQLMAVRVLAGVAAGMVVSVVMFLAGRSDRPHVLFGALNSSVGVLGILLSSVLPRLVADYDIAGAYSVYILLSAISLAFVPMLAGRAEPAAPQAGDAPRASMGLWLLVPLLGVGIVFFGHSMLAFFIYLIGIGTGVPIGTLTMVFIAISAVSVVLPILSGIYGVRLSAMLVVGVVLTVLGVSANVMANAHALPMFIIGCALYATLPTAMMPVLLTAFARRDPTGRMTAANSAFVTFGGAIGPLVGGRIVDMGGYPMVAWFSTGCFIVGAAMLAGTMISVDRRRADAADGSAPLDRQPEGLSPS
jgi:MFS family permease